MLYLITTNVVGVEEKNIAQKLQIGELWMEDRTDRVAGFREDETCAL